MAALNVDRAVKVTKQRPCDIRRLEIRNTSLEYVDDLSACTELEKVDLSRNSIEEAHGLHECTKMKWLNVSTNMISDLDFVRNMQKLSVLNAGNNKIQDMKCVCRLKELKALILNNNRISRPLGLRKLNSLSTLVLSHNSIAEIDVSGLTCLTKLQLSHNKIHTFPDISSHCELKTLSLNDNEITKVPEKCIGENRLELVDLGKNNIEKLKNITSLTHITTLRQLNIKGNPVDQQDNYSRKMCVLFPRLHILDSQPVEKLINAKKKQVEDDDVPSKSKTGQKRSHNDDSGMDIAQKKRKTNKKSGMEDEAGSADEHSDGQTKKSDVTAESDDQITDEKPKPKEDDASEHDDNDTKKTNSKKKKKKSKHPDPAASAGQLKPMVHELKETTKKSKKSKKGKKIAAETKDGALVHEGGISALKDSNSGVLAIKVKKKKKAAQSVNAVEAQDIFSTFQVDIGSGSGSGW